CVGIFGLSRCDYW
nr:immunoglobulin heavy chain junction region [Macaca mulatta]MOV40589.1 immunoglobulin heavy chain junction region [Macaca mulatta]MOV40978.1 immunoglobulin heavy chain junction region [Macaca mulatta]MOV41038.1 immunoglobulin heavy chain junction region [Macaca mulatta]MOV41253.1 immunoglobulin heavy chain junction region [Macaca mulatta]